MFLTFLYIILTYKNTETIFYSVPVLLNATEYRVFAGSVLLTADSADSSRTITSFIAHPEHILHPSSVNDVAVITVSSFGYIMYIFATEL